MRLRLDQSEAAVELPLKGPLDPEDAALEVDVLPADSQHLTLAKSEGDGDHPPRLQTVLRCSLEEDPGFLDGVGPHVVARQRRWVDEECRVGVDDAPADGNGESPAQDGMDAADARWRQVLRHLTVEGGDVLWTELVDPVPPEPRVDVKPRELLVAVERGRADTVSSNLTEVRGHPRLHRRWALVGELPGLGRRKQSPGLPANFCLGLARDLLPRTRWPSGSW